MSDLTLAVVGCGAIAHWHLDAIDRAHVPITVAAAVDPDEANARRVASGRKRADVIVDVPG